MWRVTPGQTLRYRRWSGECVLYNDLSGDTHLLGEQAIGLLLALQARPSGTSDLAWIEAGETDADLDDEMLALLADLEALSLIEAVAC